jgi:hypothetical protein
METVDGSIFLAMSLRNVGPGTAVLHSWRAERVPAFDGVGNAPMARPPLEEFHPHSREHTGWLVDR